MHVDAGAPGLRLPPQNTAPQVVTPEQLNAFQMQMFQQMQAMQQLNAANVAGPSNDSLLSVARMAVGEYKQEWESKEVPRIEDAMWSRIDPEMDKRDERLLNECKNVVADQMQAVNDRIDKLEKAQRQAPVSSAHCIDADDASVASTKYSSSSSAFMRPPTKYAERNRLEKNFRPRFLVFKNFIDYGQNVEAQKISYDAAYGWIEQVLGYMTPAQRTMIELQKSKNVFGEAKTTKFEICFAEAFPKSMAHNVRKEIDRIVNEILSSSITNIRRLSWSFPRSWNLLLMQVGGCSQRSPSVASRISVCVQSGRRKRTSI